MDYKVAHHIILGTVIAIASAVFVYVLFNIGGGKGLFRSEFRLLAKFSHVKGLHYGSEVALAGLRIGVVNKIMVSSDESKALTVELLIMNHYRDRVKNDSVAAIRTQGVLGDKYIEISMGTHGAVSLNDGDWITVSEGPDLFTKGGNLIEEVAKQFYKGGEVDLLLKNINRLINNMNGIAEDIKGRNTGEKLGSALTHTDAILKKVRDGDGTLGALINDPSVYEDIKQVLGGAKRSTVLKYFMRQFIESGPDGRKK